jgi:hypothetical protein
VLVRCAAQPRCCHWAGSRTKASGSSRTRRQDEDARPRSCLGFKVGLNSLTTKIEFRRVGTLQLFLAAFFAERRRQGAGSKK